LISVSLLPAPQALTGNPHTSISHFTAAAALASTPEGQPQNLGVSGEDEALYTLATELSFAHWTCRHNLGTLIQKPTQPHQGRQFKPAGLRGHTHAMKHHSKLQIWSPGQTPDLVTTKRQHSIRSLLTLHQQSWEQHHVWGSHAQW